MALIEVRESVYIFKSVCYEFKKFVDDEMIEPALKKAARVGFEIGVLEAEATAHWDDNYKIKFENFLFFPAQYKFHWLGIDLSGKASKTLLLVTTSTRSDV